MLPRSRFQIARVQNALYPESASVDDSLVAGAGAGAAVAGGTAANLLGGGVVALGVYLMVFGSPVTQPLGIMLGAAGLIVGVYLESRGY